jgi:hypothetical protein
MRANEREIRKSRMIESCALPVIHAVAHLALERQIRGCVIQGLSVLVVVQVTTHAFGAEPRIDSRCGSFMARIAAHRRMCSQQWESVQVAFYVIDTNAPTSDGVALLACSAKLAAMDVRVTIGA